MDATFVSLDLELLDSADHGREIIEVGAVRFRGERELDSYSTLVRTTASLSHRLGRLTGLTETDFEQAVPTSEALQGLARFVGSSPVVGQSIDLDAEHLRRAGLALRVPLLDTFELAGLLLPALSRYDLESVARALKIEIGPGRHRALPDARLAMCVFNRLVERIRELDLDTLMQITRLARPLDWPLGLLFAEAERQRVHRFADSDLLAQENGGGVLATLLAPGDAVRSRETLVPNENRTSLDLDELRRAFQQGGSVADRLAGFEERPEQLEMLRAVGEAFNDSENLLVEAGTGTGKSLAYLLPAVRFAVQNNMRVVVSTATINLQDQLAHKELPSLRLAAEPTLKFSVLKGRNNYLCLRRWTALLRSDELVPEERSLLIKTLIWLQSTTTGDRVELRLAGREEEAWLKVCALPEACTARRCAYNRAGRCFLVRARRAAEGSHVVVVNHALLLADLATPSGVLPEYRHLIVDEAHHLEDEATAQLGWRLVPREITANIDRLAGTGPPRQTGLVAQSLELLRRLSAPTDQPLLERLATDLMLVITGLAEELGTFFNLLQGFVADHGQRSDAGAATVRLTASSRAQPAWSNIEISWDDHNRRLLRLLRGLNELQVLVEALPGQNEAWEELLGELAIQVSFWDTLRDRFWAVFVQPDPNTIAWLALGRADEVVVNAAPLNVGEQLKEGLFAEKDCVILTSATLTAEQSFRYLRSRLAIEESRELVLGSPFDYQRSVLVYLPDDLPEPNAPGYQQAVERVTGELIAGLEGRTLVLFTSYSQLRATYQSLKEPLEARQITLLGQRMDGASRARLLESFKTGDRVALMGTTSFWEGVDVVGDALSCLVIARLPFTMPTDPIFQARGEAFDDPFGEYAVPQAVLRFRQGFGRLIRSRADRGVLVVLDRRLISRSYGRTFLRSLPDCEIRLGPLSRAGASAREWLASEPAAATMGA